MSRWGGNRGGNYGDGGNFNGGGGNFNGGFGNFNGDGGSFNGGGGGYGDYDQGGYGGGGGFGHFNAGYGGGGFGRASGNPMAGFGASRMAPNLKEEQEWNRKQDGDTSDPHKGEARVIVMSNIPLDLALPKIIHEEMSKFGEVLRIKVLQNNRTTALVQMKDAENANKVIEQQEKLSRNGLHIRVQISTKYTEVRLPMPGSMQDDGYTADYTGKYNLNKYPRWLPPEPPRDQFMGPPNRFSRDEMGPMGPMGPDNGPILLVSNIPDELAQVDRIFNMLGVYGDVLCVKILFKKRDCALVHMAKPHHAAQAKQHLDQFKVGGKNLIISFSKVRNLLKDKLIDEDGLQKTYTRSSLHRFKSAMSERKNMKNLRPPSSTLHVGNIPDGLEHTDVKDLFVENGFTVVDSKDCDGKSKMCYLQIDSPEEALRALAIMHNHNSDKVKTENSKGLCVSFTQNWLK